MLEATRIVKSYGPVRALDHCDISVGAGEMVAIVGPNGAGKSTLLKVLVGLLRPEEGEVRIDGMALHEHLPEIRARVTYLGHATALYDDLTVRENMKLAWSLGGLDRRSVEARAAKALDEFGLEHRGNDRVAVLSAGLRRRAALAIHLHSGRAHILLDEPFANLDKDGQRTLREALSRTVAEGSSIALVVHDLALLEGTKYRVLCLEEGRVVPL